MKGGFLFHVLGFEVTERIQEMEAVSVADNVTLAFMNRFGRFKLQNAHIEIWKGVSFLTFKDSRSQNESRKWRPFQRLKM